MEEELAQLRNTNFEVFSQSLINSKSTSFRRKTTSHDCTLAKTSKSRPQ